MASASVSTMPVRLAAQSHEYSPSTATLDEACRHEAILLLTLLRRREPIAVCEQHQHGRQMVRGILDELVHDFEKLFDLPAPRVVELVVDTDEEDNAEGAAAADRPHDSCRIRGVDCGIIIVPVAHIIEPRRIDVRQLRGVVAVAAEEPCCRRPGVADLASRNPHVSDELLVYVPAELVIVASYLDRLSGELCPREKM